MTDQIVSSPGTGLVPISVDPEPSTARRRRKRGRRRKSNAGAIFGATWLVVIVLGALTAQWLPIPDPAEVTGQFLRPPGFHENPLGTDSLGRDVLSRLIFGARISLAVAVGATTIAMTIGVALGMLAGYFRGAADAVISLFVNLILAFPTLIFLLALVAVLEPSITSLTAGLAVMGIPAFARVARANTIAFADREFVTAAKALGAGPFRVVTRELLINVMLPMLSLFLVVMSLLVVAEGSLSFLGLGVPPPTPSWGGMLAAGQDSFRTAPSLVFIPAIFFFLTIYSFNELGNWVQSRIGKESAI